MAGWVLFFIAGVFCVNGLYVDTNANGFTVFFADLPVLILLNLFYDLCIKTI